MGKATKRMTALENRLKRSGGKNRLVKENVASNDRQIDRMILTISEIGHVSLSPLIIIVIF